jgi:hypothetical protein
MYIPARLSEQSEWRDVFEKQTGTITLRNLTHAPCSQNADDILTHHDRAYLRFAFRSCEDDFHRQTYRAGSNFPFSCTGMSHRAVTCKGGPRASPLFVLFHFSEVCCSLHVGYCPWTQCVELAILNIYRYWLRLSWVFSFCFIFLT